MKIQSSQATPEGYGMSVVDDFSHLDPKVQVHTYRLSPSTGICSRRDLLGNASKQQTPLTAKIGAPILFAWAL